MDVLRFNWFLVATAFQVAAAIFVYRARDRASDRARLLASALLLANAIYTAGQAATSAGLGPIPGLIGGMADVITPQLIVIFALNYPFERLGPRLTRLVSGIVGLYGLAALAAFPFFSHDGWFGAVFYTSAVFPSYALAIALFAWDYFRKQAEVEWILGAFLVRGADFAVTFTHFPLPDLQAVAPLMLDLACLAAVILTVFSRERSLERRSIILGAALLGIALGALEGPGRFEILSVVSLAYLRPLGMTLQLVGVERLSRKAVPVIGGIAGYVLVWLFSPFIRASDAVTMFAAVLVAGAISLIVGKRDAETVPDKERVTEDPVTLKLRAARIRLTSRSNAVQMMRVLQRESRPLPAGEVAARVNALLGRRALDARNVAETARMVNKWFATWANGDAILLDERNVGAGYGYMLTDAGRRLVADLFERTLDASTSGAADDEEAPAAAG